MDLNHVNAAAEYTAIDLNDASSTTVYDPDGDAAVYGVFLANSGDSAEVRLETTDGTDTATLAEPGAGSALEFGDTIVLGHNDALQITVATAEGATETGTCAVFRAE